MSDMLRIGSEAMWCFPGTYHDYLVRIVEGFAKRGSDEERYRVVGDFGINAFAFRRDLTPQS